MDVFRENNKQKANSIFRFQKINNNDNRIEIKEKNYKKKELHSNTFKKSSLNYKSRNQRINTLNGNNITEFNNNHNTFSNKFIIQEKTKNSKKNTSRNQPHNYSNKKLDSIDNTSTVINLRLKTHDSFLQNKFKFKNLYCPVTRNAINFIDRNKLRATKTINLKLFEKFEEELGKVNDNLNNKKIKINSNNFLDSERFFIYGSLKTLPEIKKANIFKKIIKVSNKHLNNKEKERDKFQKIKKGINKIISNQDYKKAKYSLKKLMDLNPYHSVPKNVKYCNLLEIKNISEQLSYVSGIAQTRSASTQPHFFKKDINFSNKKNTNPNSRVIESVSVIYNNNYSSKKGELVWRILQKLQNKSMSISSAFKEACIFQGYSELWKHYSLLLEKMLVNYSQFKWFIIKEKYMEKQVFTEFLQYLDIDTKENKLFPEKVFLLLNNNGEDRINIKLFYFIMELISNSSKTIDKINFLLELFEEKEKANYINVSEMQEIFKSIILHENYLKDYNHLNEIIKNEFNLDKIENGVLITKSQLFQFLLNNEFFKKLVILFKNQLKYAYYYYNEEVMSSFNSTVRNVKTFLNEQNEVSLLCKHDILNYEYILRSIKNKRKTVEKNKKLLEESENNVYSIKH